MMKVIKNISQESWIVLIECLSSPFGSYHRIVKKKLLPIISLGIPPTEHCRWCKKLCLFYKISKENKSSYLFNLIPIKNLNYDTRNTDKITLFHAKHGFFKKKKILSIVIEWNKLDPTFKNTASPWLSKKNLSKFVTPSPNIFFNCCNCC